MTGYMIYMPNFSTEN